jgi:hypothetical protein
MNEISFFIHLSKSGIAGNGYLWSVKASQALLIVTLAAVACRTDTQYAYIGQADMENFGSPKQHLVLYNSNGNDSMVLELEGPIVDKSINTNSQWYGLKRSRTEAESRWFTYRYQNGNGNIHIGLSSDGNNLRPLTNGQSLLQIQPDISGAAFFSVYCQNGALLPGSGQTGCVLTHRPIDTIPYTSGRFYTGCYRLERAQPRPGWLHWTAVWIRPGQVLAGLETAGGDLYLAH